MGRMSSQITSLTRVRIKYQSSALQAFVTGGFPSQRTSNAENVSIWWRHHVCMIRLILPSTTHIRVKATSIFITRDSEMIMFSPCVFVCVCVCVCVYGTNNCWFPLARKWPTWKLTWIWIPYGKIEKKMSALLQTGFTRKSTRSEHVSHRPLRRSFTRP